MVKITRKKAIRDLIVSQPIENQASLVELLKEKYGIVTNQSIVSRELRRMNVTKQSYRGTMVYEIKDVDVSREILRHSLVSIEYNETMILVTVLAGVADFVGDYLDAHKDEIKILGTLAGENMIFVMPVSVKKIQESYKLICALLHYKSIKNKE